MLAFLLKAGLVVAAAGLGLDLLKHIEESNQKKEDQEQPRLPLLKDQELPNTPVDLPKVMPMKQREENKEDQ